MLERKVGEVQKGLAKEDGSLGRAEPPITQEYGAGLRLCAIFAWLAGVARLGVKYHRREIRG